MLQYPQIDPIIFQVGPLAPRWYGMMYLLGFVFTYLRIKKNWRWLGLKSEEEVDSVLGTLVLSMLLCSRLIYVTVYNWEETMNGPWWEFLAVWHGGLAFHGGLLGVVVGAFIVAYRHKLHWLRLTDVVASIAPVGLGLGRIGNFINAELWGRTSDVPWAMVFPGGGPLPRHPSQLYQAFLEGIVFYCIVNYVWKKKPNVGVTSVTFLLSYGVLRIIGEFFREPDAQLGFIFGPLTMGQLLSILVLAGGGVLFWHVRRLQMPNENPRRR